MAHPFALLCVCLVALPALISGSTWNYNTSDTHDGPAHWEDTYAACAGSSQSPIDLTGATHNSSLGTFTFMGYSSADTVTDYTLNNNGHTAQVSFNSSATSMSITGAGLTDTYTLAQFHFHWGSDSSQGSEHTVDGFQYAAELHLVHYNSDLYDSLGSAASQSEGLAVLGVFIEESGSANSAFSTVTDELSNIIYETDAEVDLTQFALADLLPSDLTQFFRYSGSLTTPGCAETVVWTVFRNPIYLSTAQMNLFRSIFENDNSTAIEDNFRPVQALNSRPIQSSWDESSAAPPALAVTIPSLMGALMAVMAVMGRLSLK